MGLSLRLVFELDNIHIKSNNVIKLCNCDIRNDDVMVGITVKSNLNNFFSKHYQKLENVEHFEIFNTFGLDGFFLQMYIDAGHLTTKFG